SLLTLRIVGAMGDAIQRGMQVDQASEELRVQNARFHAALNNMPHGVSMYDGDGRFVVSNSRYLEIYGFTPEEARLGAPFARMMERRMALDATPADPPALAAHLPTHPPPPPPVLT